MRFEMLSTFTPGALDGEVRPFGRWFRTEEDTSFFVGNDIVGNLARTGSTFSGVRIASVRRTGRCDDKGACRGRAEAVSNYVAKVDGTFQIRNDLDR